jgi:hypothetical protein
MMSERTSTTTIATWRDKTATGLMLLAPVGAFFSCVTSISSVAAACPATLVVEIWRMYGFIVFIGLYVFLAFWPRHYAGIWELAILDKAAWALPALYFSGEGW